MGNPDHVSSSTMTWVAASCWTDTLVGNGYRVTTVANGRQMREAPVNHRVDLIVLDLMLPGDDGLTLCRNFARINPTTFRS
jgi:two-component system OmpR family response regulator